MNLVYAALLLLGSGATLMVLLRTVLREGTGAIVRRPIVLFSLYYFVVHFFTPMAKHINGYYRYQPTYSDLAYVCNATLALSIYALVYILLRQREITLPANAFCAPASKRVRAQTLRAGALLYMAGAFFAYRDINAIQGLGGVESFLVDRHLSSEERGSLRVFANFMIIGVALFAGAWLDAPSLHGRRLYQTVLAMMSGFAIYYFVLLSARNAILILIVSLVAVYSLLRPTKIKVSASGIRYLALSVGLGVFLALATYQITIDRYSVVDNAYFAERLDNVLIYALDGAFGNDEALLWFFDHEYDLFLGQTYLAGLLNFIPRSLWTEKLLGAGPNLINLIEPGAYVLGSAGNNSLTTGLLTEARMNFGLIGVFFVTWLWSKPVALLLERAFAARHRVLQIGLALSSVALVTMFLYYEFLGFVVHFSILLVPCVVFSAIYRMRMSR